jgi:hypothetical protein
MKDNFNTVRENYLNKTIWFEGRPTTWGKLINDCAYKGWSLVTTQCVDVRKSENGIEYMHMLQSPDMMTNIRLTKVTAEYFVDPKSWKAV